MKYLLVISAVTVLLMFIISCQKESKSYKIIRKNNVEYIINKNSRIDDDNIVKVNKVKSISGYDEKRESICNFTASYLFKVDTKGNLFIYDKQYSTIKVYNDKGLYQNSISRLGKGPTENENFITFYIYKDTVQIIDNFLKIKKFGIDGEYYYTKTLESRLLFDNIIQCNDSTILASYKSFYKKDNKVHISNNLKILNNNFKEKKTISKEEYSYESMPYNDFFKENIFSVREDIIYLSHRSKSEYKIECYDLKGELIKVISKNFLKSKYSNQELDLIKKDQPNNPYFKKFYDYKISLYDLHIDDNGYIWVERNSGLFNKNIEFDIFNSKGVFIKKFIFPSKNDEILFNFSNEKIYILNTAENLIDVYNYKY
ncbi:MAG: hypothetical protein CR982_04755 [Candidatus Cloacimonadota bacterium]|nr:MAG: hypothetical protein CR982_04755 [Candidatus Cloacimonadota bacterium]PIE81758.1 MAG: hypothetical protein CSA15_00380 [Candidatus Delongbacteria bacterium]